MEDVRALAKEAAHRLIAVDEGLPGADDEIEYLDAIAVARALDALVQPITAEEVLASLQKLRPAQIWTKHFAQDLAAALNRAKGE